MTDRRPDHIVKACGHGHPVANVKQLVGAIDNGAPGNDPDPQTGSQIAGQHRHYKKQDQRQKLALARDLEGIARLGEKEIIRQESDPGGKITGPRP